MLFGNLERVWDGEQSIMEAVEQKTREQGDIKKPGRISKILTMLASYGMNYEDKVYKNMVAIPADKALQPKDPIFQQTLYGNSG